MFKFLSKLENKIYQLIETDAWLKKDLEKYNNENTTNMNNLTQLSQAHFLNNEQLTLVNQQMNELKNKLDQEEKSRKIKQGFLTICCIPSEDIYGISS